ncbi:hypothetical protein NDU88_003976 [Pleurodeles waltl]|uniref:Uncharacterized protein n=1 Tax=Pleurodeles waltl TaxID=8319 RepID=A0AAV7PIF5_PLEWA|nr:hypothetical protein NDU88_003976 [Pleurodeles waltl]
MGPHERGNAEGASPPGPGNLQPAGALGRGRGTPPVLATKSGGQVPPGILAGLVGGTLRGLISDAALWQQGRPRGEPESDTVAAKSPNSALILALTPR